MKIINIVFSMALFLLLTTSITLADGSPLKVDASMGGGNNLYLEVINVSNKSQEFYTQDCFPERSFITDDPSIHLIEGPGLSTVTNYFAACENGFKKVTLKPSDNHQFGSENGIMLIQNGHLLYNTKVAKASKLISVKLGFIYLNKDGNRDTSKEVMVMS